MAVHLLKDEKILWKSFPGKKYRLFIFSTQFGASLIVALLLNQVSKELKLSNVFGDNTITFLTIGVIIVGLIFSLYNQVMLMFTQYFITTDRIIIKTGWLNRKLTSIKHENIHDTKVEQSFSERLISTGHIYIFTANDTSANFDEKNYLNNTPCFQNIDNPFHVHRILEEAIEENSKQH